MWFGKIDELACQRSKVTANNIKSLITEKGSLNFFYIYFSQNISFFFDKVWFWDGHGFMSYVQFSLFLGRFNTTSVTKKAIS